MGMKDFAKQANDRAKILGKIAKDHLFMDTLETRGNDAQDFHDLSTRAVKDALEAAFKAGREHGLTIGQILSSEG